MTTSTSTSPNPRSIASHLVWLFTLAAALLLACALGVFYSIIVRHAFAEDNAVLADKISALSADLRQNGPVIFAEELTDRHTGEHLAYWIRMLDSKGRSIAETRGMDRSLPMEIFPAPQPGLSFQDSIRNRKAYRFDRKMFSLVAITENLGDKTYTLQVAQDRSSDEQVERNFAILFVVVLLGGLVASALIAIIVTRRGLRPLRQMTRALGRIGPEHLNERINFPGWPRELQPLAIAFDEMLGRLEDSFTRLSQFSADLAHELRTPVGNILGEAQVALTRERAPDEYREVLASTVAECERLSKIVDNLLFVARADAAREPIERNRFDARAAVEKIASFYQAVAEDHRVTIICRGGGQIYADPDLFERAVGNLLDNALRFTPENGSIQIALSQHDTDFEVTVSDTGSGIAPEHLPRVFDRFYRVDPSRSAAGTGLGLALVKSIAHLHGGSVKIESAVGRGTTVKIIFPLR